MLQPLESQREMGTALGRRHRVDLVDEDGLHVSQRLPRRRGQHQIERLGGRDEQIRGMPNQPTALVGRCVAGAHPDRRDMHRVLQAITRQHDAVQRRPEVLLDIDRQGPQRRDIEQPSAGFAVGDGLGHQPIETP